MFTKYLITQDVQMVNTNYLFVIFLFFYITSVDKPDYQDSSYLWTMDTPEEILDYGNDRTGAVFKFNNSTYLIGNRSVEVFPSGGADDTKLSLPLKGERLQKWIGHDRMAFNIYLPEDNYVNPTNFFLGMADITGGSWSWVHGTHWDQTELGVGWNQIAYSLNDSMKNLSPDGEYTIFIFFTAYMPPREDDIKLPLHESFIIDGIKML